MNTTATALLIGTVVVVGKWSEEKPPDYVRLAIGSTVLAVSLSVMSSSNEQLAKQFATLILVGALFRYAIPISKKSGLVA